MRDVNEHLKKEYEDWEKVQQNELTKLNSAMRHLLLNVFAYLAISIIEWILASMSHSQTLRADAFNNLSGIISTALLMIGIHIARDIDDDDIAGVFPLPKHNLRKTGNDQRVQFTRFRYETIFTLVTGIVMIAISLSVIISGITGLLSPDTRVIPQPIALVGAGIASVIMLLVWYFNKRAGRKLKNASLIASAQDSLSDAFTSLGTLISIAGAWIFKITWLDGATSILVGLFILYSGARIFIESSLNLADYFDPQAEDDFRQTIKNIHGVTAVDELKAHYNGNLVTVDVVIVVDANMNVLESYNLAEHIESIMRVKFGVIDTDVSFLPDTKTITSSTQKRLLRNRRKHRR
ncbi:cation diffusion facilitator family transporter [Ligilactobacillus apodemi]|uniref:cation diffusion facilitator family transporter n=1 Tax=Ligilactobacillus apodemi TaxID=307126 RepID=UPI00214C4703|nr:cation diffusion facilitator family transporter [Ligilactobacillus apodemi]MCR1901473.1 cation diffusion facilitator family transporter [Ligilactobacillus apodemi]